MRSRRMLKKMTSVLAALFLLFFLSACAGGKTVKSSEPAPASPSKVEEKEAPLAARYDGIVLQKFESDPKIEADYPGAVAECENSALAAVKAKNIFKSVEKGTTGAGKKGVLLVKAKVTNLRIVAGAARFWAGPWAGSSDMSLQMKLVDAATGAVVREKDLSTNNNPWAAAWTWGASDRSLPTDLGAMVAEYLAAIQ